MDPYFPKTANLIKKAKNLCLKQQQSKKEMRYIPTITIKNLYYRLLVAPYVTLTQVVMYWRLAQEPKKCLFQSQLGCKQALKSQTMPQSEWGRQSSNDSDTNKLPPEGAVLISSA
jgi:hypothetical protein